MTGRTIIITGASDGIGAAAARALSGRGDTVVLVGRSPEKTAAVARELGAPYYLADFASLAEVRELAATLAAAYPRIDVLANNAGGIMAQRELTVDGLEKTLQVNHLAPFLLTNLLLPNLIRGRATVIATSSAANELFGRIDTDDLQNERKYSSNRAYGDAKLANILFARELDFRFRAQGIASASFHPGVIATNFAAGSSSPMRVMYRTVVRRLLGTAETGADTLVWLATSRPGIDWPLGEYFIKRRVAKAARQAYEAGLATWLWDASAELVGLSSPD
ncbi:SDR family NAD(P)-dependent oxidoreductase [Salinibacterium sp.]|uniref:SDR family NAD(P)-dependent oxidoreductase n=1 Tax=Salinibacterium sp. TaxID=1915057 RepID=UPI00286C70B8|nr:SDR family NAD(P)-dependent oxidoreductase [Salinibacterium sp.]